MDSQKVGLQGSLGKTPLENGDLGGSISSESSEPAAPSPPQDSGPVGSQDGQTSGGQAPSPHEDSSVPNIREVVIRDKGGPTTGYSLIVPLKVKRKNLDGVVDTGADGTVINSKFIDITQFEAQPVALKGLEPNRLISGHFIKDVPINLGGRMYRWDLYVAPIADDFLLGLDFMIAYKVDPLISRNVLMVGGIEVPATLKRGSSGQQQGIGRVQVSRRTIVPPNSIMRMECKVDRDYEGNTCLVSPGCGKRGLAIPYTAVNVQGGKVITQVANLSDNFITLKEGYSLGSIEEIDEVLEEETGDDSIPTVRTCTTDFTSGGSSSGGECPSEDNNTTSSGPGTVPRTEGGDDPILDSIWEKLPHKTLENVQSHMPDHISKMFKSSCENLTEEQAIIFGNLLIDFQNIFAKDDTDLGCFVGV